MKTWAELGIHVDGSSGHERTLCPKCSGQRKKSKDKCLSVNLDEKIFYCHHCFHRGGLNGKTHEEYKTYFTRPKYVKSDLPENVVKWFKGRGISEKILVENNIGYGKSFKDKNAILFPYYKDGVVVNVKHRAFDKTMRQEKGAEKCLYRYDSISKGKGTMVITEGEVDCLTLLECGFGMVASVPDGAPSSNAKEFNTKFDFLKSAEVILNNYSKIIIAVDNDAPGITLERELVRRIGVEKCYKVEYPKGCKDANDVLIKYGKADVVDLVKNSKPYPVDGIIMPKDLKQDTLHIYENGIARGVKTGWSQLDPYYTVKLGEVLLP